MSATPDIFLSYNREDQATARRFAEGFAREGFDVWWDATLRSGEAYDEVTEKALRDARAVVVLWSKKSVVSRWVRAEATLADRNKTLVPAMIEPCERPIMFELTQTAELRHWQGKRDDAAWQAFLADVRRFVEKQRATAQPAAASEPAVPRVVAKPGERGEAPSLAVLPFNNRSGLSEDEVFAIGMVEDVIDALSQGALVRVISSAATAGFRKGAIIDLPAVARQLGVRYILEGNVRRAGASLRVTAQLVEGATSAILWTQKFDRPLSELAALQEDLVREVASHLDAQVYGLEMQRALRKPSDLTAWEAAMLSLHHAKQQITSANADTALEQARRAVAIAPDYGLAHAILAHLSGLRYLLASPDDAAEVERVQGMVGRALALDPDNAAVLTYVAHSLCFIGRPQEALRHAERAVRMSPRMADALHVRGIACTLLNRSDEAIDSFEADLQAAPGAVTNQLNFVWQGVAHLRAGRAAEATAAFERSLALNPDHPMALAMRAVLFMQSGRSGEAQGFFEPARRLEPGLTLALWELGFTRWFAGSAILPDVLETVRQLWKEARAA